MASIQGRTSEKWRASAAGRLGLRYGDGVLTRVEDEERVEETLLTYQGIIRLTMRLYVMR